MAPKIIEQVTLSEIRAGDGAMLFTWTPNPDDPPGSQGRMWLSGLQRPTNVKVGAQGRLVPDSTPAQLWYRFEQYPA